jgi:hypothetical protein
LGIATDRKPGLNALNGLVVNQSSISLKPDAQGDNFFATVYVPNASPVTFELVS